MQSWLAKSQLGRMSRGESVVVTKNLVVLTVALDAARIKTIVAFCLFKSRKLGFVPSWQIGTRFFSIVVHARWSLKNVQKRALQLTLQFHRPVLKLLLIEVRSLFGKLFKNWLGFFSNSTNRF